MDNSFKTAFEICRSIMPETIHLEYDLLGDELVLFDKNNPISYSVPIDIYKRTKDPVYFIWGMYERVMEIEESVVTASWFSDGNPSVYADSVWRIL